VCTFSTPADHPIHHHNPHMGVLPQADNPYVWNSVRNPNRHLHWSGKPGIWKKIKTVGGRGWRNFASTIPFIFILLQTIISITYPFSTCRKGPYCMLNEPETSYLRQQISNSDLKQNKTHSFPTLFTTLLNTFSATFLQSPCNDAHLPWTLSFWNFLFILFHQNLNLLNASRCFISECTSFAVQMHWNEKNNATPPK